MRWTMLPDGSFEGLPEIEGMVAPTRCGLCAHVYDAADVVVTARYADCSVWRCPGCGASVDDRRFPWTGRVTAIPLGRG